MIMNPIGYVKSGCRSPEEMKKACELGLSFRGRSSIVLDEKLSPGLQGLEGFSHAWVLFHLDREDRVEVRTYPGPKTIEGLPDVGLFASRSQCRPNHIGLRLVRVASVKGSELEVEGLDAVDGSPVLDIKPFVPMFDSPDDVKTPGWCKW